MIVDRNGNERPITSDEYTAERCLLLEAEIERLKAELERCKYNKTFQWVLTSLDKESSFITTIKKDGTITIKELVEGKNE